MKVHFFSAMLLIMCASVCHAQHAGDVEFGYDSTLNPTSFDIDASEFTIDGLLYFESEFEVIDPFDPGNFGSEEPGFVTNLGEGLSVNQGDQIWLRALDASLFSPTFGKGFVNYYNPVNDSLTASGRLAIIDNSVSTADLVLNGSSIESGLSNQFVDFGSNSGEVHSHLVIDLLDDANSPVGAYGVLFQLQSDFSPTDGTMNISSDPFWIVWNHGMTESDFDTFALPKFGVAVPEPSTVGFLGLSLWGACLARRRR